MRGIYYPPGSLKARLCVQGKSLLYEYLRERELPYANCGKVLVATDPNQVEMLANYCERAHANGAGALRWLTPAEVRAREPRVRCVAGLASPTTGVVDSHAYMTSLHGDIENAAGTIAFGSVVLAIRFEKNRLLIETDDVTLNSRLLVNAAGLHAPELYQTLNPRSAYKIHYAKGHYYALTGRSPFSQLVYPIAEAGGLGIHVTLDLLGNARFGPDVRWVDTPDYAFDDSHRAQFVSAIRRYYPDLNESRLQPAYTGIRPKIVGAGEPPADFVIESESIHGIPGLINLFGIESPGLTASLAIGEYVASLFSATR